MKKSHLALFTFVFGLCTISCLSNNANGKDSFVKAEEVFPEADCSSSFSVSFVDFNKDEFVDIFITNWEYGNSKPNNFLYLNNQEGSFNRITNLLPATEGGSLGHSWGDFDNDGDLDLSVANPGIQSKGESNYLYISRENRDFRKESKNPFTEDLLVSMTTSWIDYDNDGFLDIFSVNHGLPSDTQKAECFLFRNIDGQFIRLDNHTIGLIRDEANSISCGDFNGDGFVDLFLTRNQGLNLLYKNLGNGQFQWMKQSIISQEKTGSGNWIDYDNDGDLDLFTIGFEQPNTLYQNLGDDKFKKIDGLVITEEVGYNSSSNWADIDNDGDLDLFLAANKFYKPEYNSLFRNNGDGTFSKIEEGIIANDLEASSAGAWGDYDRDGDQDLLVVNTNKEANSLYINRGNKNSWINIKLSGTKSNHSAFGAKIRIKAVINDKTVWQLRELTSQNGFLAQNDINVHFGLGDAKQIDVLRIEWPSGIIENYENIGVKQHIVITEKGSLETL